MKLKLFQATSIAVLLLIRTDPAGAGRAAGRTGDA